MRRRLRLCGRVALAVVGASGLAGCVGLGPTSTVQDDTTLSQKVTSVRLDNPVGSVTLRGGTSTTVSVHRSVHYRGNRPGATSTVENGVLVLRGCGDNCAVDYTVDLPAGLPVSGGTSAGEISLSRVGEVHVTTDAGEISLDGVTGAVDVRSTNGRIDGRGLDGGIQAETTNGQIDLTVVTPQNVRAETTNGQITVTVPAASYRVSAEVTNGTKNIGVTDDPAAQHRLDLTTTNGSITVRPG